MTESYQYYGVYRSCRDAAWRCCIDFGIDRLPVKLMAAARHMGIHVVRNSGVHELREGEFGASIYNFDHWVIVYDDSLPAEESRMVLAHELGHILMGHEYKYASRRFISSGKQKSEHEADMFAIRLLAPACVLHELNVLDADGIAALCRIPHDAAVKRAARMRTLEARQKFYQSKLETEAMNGFLPFIAEKRAGQ